MQPRVKIVIAAISGITALSLLVSLGMAIIKGQTKPQVVITIPAAISNSPLPYSTPLQSGYPPAHSGQRSSHYTTIPSQQFQSSPAIAKFKKPGDGFIDLNKASVEDLERLPGIGPAMAARIFTARTELGRFRKPSDLLEVRGIGEKKFAKMQPFIRIN
jgi:competence ComEA-like helix-hairpin-helix protein